MTDKRKDGHESDCTCPRCRKGYIPGSYTFGGNVPPQTAGGGPLNAADTIIRSLKQKMHEEAGQYLFKGILDKHGKQILAWVDDLSKVQAHLEAAYPVLLSAMEEHKAWLKQQMDHPRDKKRGAING